MTVHFTNAETAAAPETTPPARRGIWRRTATIIDDDGGMSTVEYAVGTVAAAAFGAVLYTVVTGNGIVSALTRIVEKALNTST